ncbi:MAG: dethiobiotin synthase [Pedosphaera sp.]|nr:dethiobiotin synthase [Pedosphaera sp.]
MHVIVVTGTGTNVGKTVLSTLFVRHLKARGMTVAAFKPLCSGGRSDALKLAKTLGSVPVDIINPWYFRQPLAPAIAAQLTGRSLCIDEITTHVRIHTGTAEVTLVEAAGGLLSPLASDGDAPELIKALKAYPVLVSVNRLGVIHDVRSALANTALKRIGGAPVLLMAPLKRDFSYQHNLNFLRDELGEDRLFHFPRLSTAALSCSIPVRLEKELDRLLAALKVKLAH